MKTDYLIVGAGFTGSILAERISSQLNKDVIIIDKRNHIGGNCYDYKNNNGIIVQKYGPHIFHTNHEDVYKYLSQFTDWNNYKHKVLAYYKNEYYPIPINLNTINKFYKINLKNKKEILYFLNTKKTYLKKINNSKDLVISKIGYELYNAFIRNYTIKQWDKYPEDLDKSILDRIKIKYNKNNNYFNDKYQGMPIFGFSYIFKKLLSNNKIKLLLNTDFYTLNNRIKYNKLIYTGKIDDYFNYKFGKLEYRCSNFQFENLNIENYQSNSVVNFPEKSIDYSRITEFKKFYNIKSKSTTICKEKFTWKGEPGYPVLTKKNNELLQKYKYEADKLNNIYFIGRLAQFQYLNIDQTIKKALNLFKKLI